MFQVSGDSRGFTEAYILVVNAGIIGERERCTAKNDGGVEQELDDCSTG